MVMKTVQYSKNMTVNYDQNANKVTFTSQGVTTARGTHTNKFYSQINI